MKRILSAIAGVCVLLGGAICLPANAAISPLDLVNPVADYKIYVSEKLDVLVRDTKTFTDAIKAGDLAAAKKQYAPTRVSYETIEPIAELFSDLDSTIDSRADDHEKREADPGFIGFHRLEYGLFAKNSTNGLGPIADKLMADILDLRKRVAGLAFPPERVVGGAAALLEEVAATKVSGEEDRYSHTDLWDFQANIDGAKKIVDLFRPLIEGENEGFFKKVDANFATVDRILAKYKTPDGFKAYVSVTDRDRVALIGPVNTLAEDLSDLRGLLDLN